MFCSRFALQCGVMGQCKDKTYSLCLLSFFGSMGMRWTLYIHTSFDNSYSVKISIICTLCSGLIFTERYLSYFKKCTLEGKIKIIATPPPLWFTHPVLVLNKTLWHDYVLFLLTDWHCVELSARIVYTYLPYKYKMHHFHCDQCNDCYFRNVWT